MTPIIHTRSSFFDLQPQDKVMVGYMPYIVDRAARGGMGCVFLLWLDSKNAPERMSALGLKLALKAVLPEAADQEGIALFKRELTVWSGFRHPNIIWLLEIVDGGDAGWVAAMDWCIGSLRDLLNERHAFSLKDSTDIISQLLDGLAYAYEQDQVLHLDLKPENVLYHLDVVLMHDSKEAEDSLRKYQFMLSDWGIASIKQPRLNAIAGLPPTTEAAQRTFNNMGTILYMAPERFKRGFSSSVASDIFSLGMIYLEMLTGRLPFRTGLHPVESLLSQHYLRDAATLLRSANIPKPISSVILSMIAFSPPDRPKNYSTLRSQIVRGWRKANGLLSPIFN